MLSFSCIFSLNSDHLPISTHQQFPLTNLEGWRFSRDTWSQPATCFPAAAHAVSQGRWAYKEENTIRPLPHTRTQRHPWLASIAIIDRREREYSSRPAQRARPVLLLWLRHCWNSNSLSNNLIMSSCCWSLKNIYSWKRSCFHFSFFSICGMWAHLSVSP